MTKQKSFKRLVRTRMEKTGESYTAARAVLLRAEEQPATAEAPPLATSDAAIRERTGRGWEDWFDELDAWGELSHRDRARRVAAELGIDPLAWNAQAIAHSYERARGLRELGQRDDGFAVTASKTIAVPVERLFDAFVGSVELPQRTATRPKSARFDADGGTRVHATFAPKDGGARSIVAVEHARLADAGRAEAMKAHWRERLAELKTRLEAGDDA